MIRQAGKVFGIALLAAAVAARALSPDPASPETYRVALSTNIHDPTGAPAEEILVEVTRAWAPLGSDRFYALLGDSYFDGAAFFRVVPGFVVQFGIAALPEETAKCEGPVLGVSRSISLFKGLNSTNC